jgi:hypothetical protein
MIVDSFFLYFWLNSTDNIKNLYISLKPKTLGSFLKQKIRQHTYKKVDFFTEKCKVCVFLFPAKIKFFFVIAAYFT